MDSRTMALIVALRLYTSYHFFLNISQLLLSSHAIERLQFKISNLKLTNLSFLGY